MGNVTADIEAALKELEKEGAETVVGERYPFIKFPEDGESFISFIPESFWEGKHGTVATVELDRWIGDIIAVIGSRDDQQTVTLKRGLLVNVDCSLAEMKGRVKAEHRGHKMAVTCKGKHTNDAGQAQWSFTVLSVPK